MSRPTTRPRRALPLLAIAAVLLTAVAGSPAQAENPTPQPRIVGGVQSANGAWPSQAAVLTNGVADRFNAQYCGATIISKSWALSAGHCFDDGAKTPASQVDILAETNDLEVGGRRVRAKEIRYAPGWNPNTLQNDITVIRLDTPVNAPAMPIIPQSAGVAPGTNLITSGWGNTSYDGSPAFPTLLREVNVPYVADSSCASIYDGNGEPKVFIDTMICAGYPGVGVKDSCNGDSGGPISRFVDGKWQQIGIVSWGMDCGDATYPGVYSRVAKFTNWINAQIRYGAQPDAASFVRQQYKDFQGKSPSTSQLNSGVSAVQGTTLANYVSSHVQGAVWQGRAGGIARQYRAYFDRDADNGGMTYWIGRLQTGASLQAVSNAFANSSEFQNTYGALTNQQFVELVYSNVLDRAPDAAGLSFWTGELNAGRKTRGQVMTGFAESNEFKVKTKTRTDVTVTFFGLLRRVPTAGEYTSWMAQSNLSLIQTILPGFNYAARF